MRKIVSLSEWWSERLDVAIFARLCGALPARRKKPNQHTRRRCGGVAIPSLFRQRAMWIPVFGTPVLSVIRAWCRRRDAGKRYVSGSGWAA